MTTEIDTRKDQIAQVVSQRTVGLASHKQEEAKVLVIKEKLEHQESEYENQMASFKDKVEGKIRSIIFYLI